MAFVFFAVKNFRRGFSLAFLDQHPNYKQYGHDELYVSEVPYSFKQSFLNFIHSALLKDEEDVTFHAWSIQNQMAALVEASPSEQGPYDFLIDEIRRVLGELIRKGFPSVMDGLEVIISTLDNEEDVDRFLKEQDIGFTPQRVGSSFYWEVNEDVIDHSIQQPSFLDDLEHIGKPKAGFFAVVTKYVDAEKNYYALKTLKKEFNEHDTYKRRFKREIDILERLNQKHRNIIPIIDSRYNEDTQEYWYLMPYAHSNLYDFVKTNNNKLELEKRLNIFEQILSAMEYAHSEEILHRDLSAYNVLLDQNGHVYVSDFGLSKDYTNLSRQGYSSVQGYGAHLYVAPEQQDKLKAATKKSDVYSLGKVLYFILTGREPRATQDSKLFSSILSISTSESPDGRYDDARHFKNEFNKYRLMLRKLQSQSNRTVAEYVSSMDTESQLDFMTFHELVLKAEVDSHIYYDYIDPIITSLDNPNIIDTYVNEVKEDIIKFTEIFINKLHECYSQVGWPFNAINSFGYFLNNLYKYTSDYPFCRLMILKELWHISTSLDQWSVQDLTMGIIKNNIPEELQTEFAMHIMQVGQSFTKLDSLNMAEVSTEVRNAIKEVRKKN